MRIVLLFHLTILYLFAYQYNPFLLKTQVKLYPKIILFEKKLAHKKDGTVELGIVYDPIDRYTAIKIFKELRSNYKMIGKERFIPKLLKVRDFLTDKNRVDAIYVLKFPRQTAKRVAKKALENSILSFVYDVEDLRYGFVIGVDIQKDLVIYLNKKAFLKGHFEFVDSFFQMVRFVEDADI